MPVPSSEGERERVRFVSQSGLTHDPTRGLLGLGLGVLGLGLGLLREEEGVNVKGRRWVLMGFVGIGEGKGERKEEEEEAMVFEDEVIAGLRELFICWVFVYIPLNSSIFVIIIPQISLFAKLSPASLIFEG